MTKFEINGHVYSLDAWYFENRYNWGHKACFTLPNGCSFETKIVYYNRTWESYRFQCVMKMAVRKALNEAERITLQEYRTNTGRARLGHELKKEIIGRNAACNELQQIYNSL